MKTACTKPTPGTAQRMHTPLREDYVQAPFHSIAQPAALCAAPAAALAAALEPTLHATPATALCAAPATALAATRAKGAVTETPCLVPCFVPCLVPRFVPRFVACSAHHLAPFLTVLAFLVSGCHVRTHEFHCKLEADRRIDFEFAMSPTQARYLDGDFAFAAERANQRLYRHSSGRELVFDLSAMRLAEYGPSSPSKPALAEGPPSPSAASTSTAPSGLAQALPLQEAKDEQFAFLRAHPPLRRWACERYRMPGGS